MSNGPEVSIVIPTFARADALDGLLQSLSQLRAPPGGFEVILVDDGGPEPLDAIVAPFVGTLALTLHRKVNGGPAGARNTGVSLARGQWIALTDDDCRPHADWLVELLAALRDDPSTMIGGQTHNGLPDNLFSDTSQLLVDYLYAHDRKTGTGARFITSNNMALSRAGFIALGGFDESFPLAAGEDRDFCDRWTASGRAIRRAPGARIDHFHALTAAGFWRQHRNYGRGAVRVHRLRALGAPESGRFERLSFYLGLVTYPLRARARQPLRKTLLMALSQLATTAGYLRETTTRSRLVR